MNTQLLLYPAQGQNAAMPLIMQRPCALTTRTPCRTPQNQSPVWPTKDATSFKMQSKTCRPLEDEFSMQMPKKDPRRETSAEIIIPARAARGTGSQCG